MHKFLLAVFLGATVAAAQTAPSAGKAGGAASKPVSVEGKTAFQEVPAREGEYCAICDAPVKSGDTAYEMDGHRIPVHSGACDEKFRAHPKLALAALQPRGAFLGGEPMKQTPSTIWFYGGVYVLVGLIFGAVCAHRALGAGHNPFVWFFGGLALNVVGYAALLARGKRSGLAAPAGIPRGLKKIATTYAPEPCAACGAANHPSATQCSDCGGKLTPRMASEVQKAGMSS